MSFSPRRPEATHSQTHPAYRPDIDGLRAVAVISVLVYHGFPDSLRGGFAGVDIFFVISGFLITTIILKSLHAGAFSLMQFYVRRILRLFPALTVVLIATLAVASMVLLPADYEELGRNTVGGALFVANIFFAMDVGYFAGVAEANPLLHLWSLGIEEQFYLAWPLVLWLAWRRKWNIGLVMMGLVMASFVHSVFLVASNPSLAFYSPLTRFWELGAGGILAWLSLNSTNLLSKWAEPRAQAIRSLASVVGLLLALLSFIVLDPRGTFPGLGAVMPVLGGVLLIAAGPRAVVNRRLLSNRWMVWVGLVSYPLYLWHWPALALVRTAFTDAIGAWSVVATILALAFSVLLAWLTYRYIETPLRHGAASRQAKVIGLAATMAAASIAGVGIWASAGIPARIAPELRPYVVADLRDEAWVASLRGGICHNMIYSGQGLGRPEVCFPQGEGPSVLLWGDSHAASLYTGLHRLQKQYDFSLWQTTTDATAPLFEEELKNNMRLSLKRVNDEVLARIAGSPPDAVLLHAFWHSYGMPPQELAESLDRAAERIRAVAPRVKVIVLGPVPVWKGSLQQNFFNSYWRNGGAIPTERMHFGLLQEPFEYDRWLKRHFAESAVEYVSAIDELCTEAGCLVKLGETSPDISYVDAQHLSASGSEYVAARILPKIMAPSETESY